MSSPSIRARPRRAPSSSTEACASLAPRRRNSRRTSRSRAGSSTIRRKSGRRVVATCRAALRKARRRGRRRSPPSASPTSARRWSSGTARPASRSTTPSSGRTGAPPTSAPRCATPAMRRGVAANTGLLLDPYFSGDQDRLDSRSRARRARAGGARRTLLRHDRLLPDLAADRRQGARHRRHQRLAHLLFDIRTGEWDDELLALFGVPRAMLPEVRDCAADYGMTDTAILGAAIPILGVAGDQQAALVGQACFAPGMMKSTYGTGCFALLNTGSEAVRSNNRLLTTIAYQVDGKRTYALEGSIFVAGAAVQWLRDGLKVIKRAADTAALARKSDPEPAGLFGAGVRRPRRAALGRRCPRRDLRHHARHHRRGNRPRRAGIGLLPDPRSARRHARRLGRRGATRCCASMAAWSRRTGPCSSSPTFSTRPSTGPKSGDDCLRRRLSRRIAGRDLSRPGNICEETGNAIAASRRR